MGADGGGARFVGDVWVLPGWLYADRYSSKGILKTPTSARFYLIPHEISPNRRWKLHHSLPPQLLHPKEAED